MRVANDNAVDPHSARRRSSLIGVAMRRFSSEYRRLLTEQDKRGARFSEASTGIKRYLDDGTLEDKDIANSKTVHFRQVPSFAHPLPSNSQAMSGPIHARLPLFHNVRAASLMRFRLLQHPFAILMPTVASRRTARAESARKICAGKSQQTRAKGCARVATLLDRYTEL